MPDENGTTMTPAQRARADLADPKKAAEEAPKGPVDPPAAAPPVQKVPQHAGVSFEQAEKQALVLNEAARKSPIRHLRYMLLKWAREWEFAAKSLEDEGEGVTIELVGALTQGMRMPCSNKRGDPDVGYVVRVMTRDNQHSVHLEVANDPAPVYLNFCHAASPCVVQS